MQGLLRFALLMLLAGPAAGAGLDFELSDGARFVRLADLPAQATVVSFWRVDCPPCLKDLPVLAEWARGGAQVVTVALHRPAQNRHPLVAPVLASSPLIALFAPTKPAGLLARFGNSQGVLPYTVLLDSQRRLCAQRTGLLDPAWLAEQGERCR